MIYSKIVILIFALTTLISTNVFSIDQSDCSPSDPDCHQLIGELKDACKNFSNPGQCEETAFKLRLSPDQIILCEGGLDQESEKACLWTLTNNSIIYEQIKILLETCKNIVPRQQLQCLKEAISTNTSHPLTFDKILIDAGMMDVGDTIGEKAICKNKTSPEDIRLIFIIQQKEKNQCKTVYIKPDETVIMAYGDVYSFTCFKAYRDHVDFLKSLKKKKQGASDALFNCKESIPR